MVLEDEGDVHRVHRAQHAAAQTTSPLRSLAFSPDGLQLAAGTDSGLITLWQGDTAAPIDALQGSAAPVQALVFSSPTSLLSAAADKLLTHWNLQPTWTLERTIGRSPRVDVKITGGTIESGRGLGEHRTLRAFHNAKLSRYPVLSRKCLSPSLVPFRARSPNAS